MPMICEIAGCGKAAVAKGLCDMHRKRYARHKDLDAARPATWGKGEAHPLYVRWGSMRRSARLSGGHDLAWDDFWTFVRDVGEPPSPTARLYRLSERHPYGPGNVTWRERVSEKGSGKTREERNAYAREYSRQRPLERKRGYLKRHYGVTLEWYDATLEAQGGVCAVCEGEERKRHNLTGETMLLAVDHDHATGTVRGLLCSQCNHGLGNFKDDPALLRAAIAYLETHPKPQSSPPSDP